MQKLIVEGGKRLRGEIRLQGSKNSSLPIIAAALLSRGECVLRNCPELSDVYAASRILNCLGTKCSFSENTAVIDSASLNGSEIPEELMREMRSSIRTRSSSLAASLLIVSAFIETCRRN